MIQRPVQFVFALVLVGALGVGVGWWRGSRDADRAGRDLAALQARVEQLEAQGASTAPGPADSPLRGHAQAPGVALPLSPTPAQMQAQRREEEEHFRTALDAAFAAQAAGPASDARTQRIERALADPAVLGAEGLPEAEDISCRAAMCLVRAKFAPGADSTDWVNRLSLEMGDTLPNSSVIAEPTTDGGTEVRIYATRANERAPVEWAERAPTR